MSDWETGRLIYLGIVLLMVGGWFVLQAREGLNKAVQQAVIWALIIVGVTAGVGLWQDIQRDAGHGRITVTQTGQIVVPRSGDGHYYLSTEINGVDVRFVVDTGATDLVLTQDDAARIGLDPDNLIFIGRANTANGQVRTARVTLDTVQLGTTVDRKVRAVVNGGELDQSLLGMGYLQRWGRLEIANNELILTR